MVKLAMRLVKINPWHLDLKSFDQLVHVCFRIPDVNRYRPGVVKLFIKVLIAMVYKQIRVIVGVKYPQAMVVGVVLIQSLLHCYLVFCDRLFGILVVFYLFR